MKKHVMNLIKSIVFVGVTVGVSVVLCLMFIPKTSDLEGGMTNPTPGGFMVSLRTRLISLCLETAMLTVRTLLWSYGTNMVCHHTLQLRAIRL